MVCMRLLSDKKSFKESVGKNSAIREKIRLKQEIAVEDLIP